MAPLTVGAAGTRLTRVSTEASLPANARVRLTDVQVVVGAPALAAARTRLTDLHVEASPPPQGSTVPRTRLTDIAMSASQPGTSVGTTRLVDLTVLTGPIYQSVAALPCVFYLSDDGSYRPYLLLSLDDFPWN